MILFRLLPSGHRGPFVAYVFDEEASHLGQEAPESLQWYLDHQWACLLVILLTTPVPEESRIPVSKESLAV